jgi:two-component system response regulator AtoC
MSENLIESELFGYEKGAFTGAAQRKKGLFEAANGGTLFIDEVSKLSPPLQTKLLRVLETGQIRRIGGTEHIKIDVRIITATHRELQNMVPEGQFRQDLFYRLSAFPIQVPSLRDRKDDITRIAENFLAKMHDGDHHLPLAPDVIEKLMAYDYPGNVRELRNVIERAAVLAADKIIRPDHIVFDSNPEPSLSTNALQTGGSPSPVRILSRRHGRLNEEAVIKALELARGHRARASELLGVSERTLYRYIKRLQQEGQVSEQSDQATPVP